MPLLPDENKNLLSKLFAAARRKPWETVASLVLVGASTVVYDEVRDTLRLWIFGGNGRIIAPRPHETLEGRAAVFVAEYAKAWSLPSEAAVAKVLEMYAAEVNFYGKTYTYNDLFFVKADFVERWPIRDYQVLPETVSVTCDNGLCYFHGNMKWYVRSDERDAQERGVAHVEITLQQNDDGFLIVTEGSAVTDRD